MISLIIEIYNLPDTDMNVSDLIIRLFRLEHLKNDGMKRKGVILVEIMLTILLLITVTYIINIILIAEYNARFLLVLSLVWVFTLMLIYLVRRGKVQLSAIIYVSFLMGMIFLFSWSGGGIRGHGIKSLPVVILFAGLTLGRKEVWIFGLVAVLGGLILVLAENYQVLTKVNPVGQSVWTYWIYSMTGILALCYLETMSIGQLQKALEESQSEINLRKQSEELLKEKNQNLMDVAFLQSHIVRKPVANVLGIIDMIDTKDPHNPNNTILLSKLSEAATELDEVIHEIVMKTNEIKKSE